MTQTRKLAAILVAGIVGYSRLAGEYCDRVYQGLRLAGMPESCPAPHKASPIFSFDARRWAGPIKSAPSRALQRRPRAGAAEVESPDEQNN